MEINVGDYVRTKNKTFQPSQIAKIVGMEKDSGYKNQYYITLDHNLIPDYEFHIYKEDIDKSSENIIDLIQVGDYVNGSKVIDIRTDEELEIGVESDNLIYHYIQNKDIKSILTHEQFEANAYKIEKER
jgi:hypothetical protein